jgi:membrane protein implicated in regulation of membrane protease activity
MLLPRLKRAITARALAMLTGVALAAGGIAWTARLSTEQTLIAILFGTALAEVVAVWWEERGRARRTAGAPAGLLKLIGAEGQVAVTCAPRGKVRIGLELWEGRCAGESLAAGRRVVVCGVQGNTLLIEPVQQVPRGPE